MGANITAASTKYGYQLNWTILDYLYEVWCVCVCEFVLHVLHK